MSTRRPSGRSEGRSAISAATAGRGIALVVVAAALGLLLLGKALDGPSSAEITGGVTPETPEGGTTPVDASTTVPVTAAPTTVAPAIDPAVKVIVANGSGIGGVAGRFTDTLGAAGALMGTPTNLAEAQPRVDGSTVYYVSPQAEPTARAVAAAMSNPTVTVPVAALPSADLIENADIQGAGVVVVVGRDLGAA